MNQELAEFFVKFTTEGLAEVKGAIDDLSKKMDDVSKSTEKADKSQSSFFGKIVKWGTLLAGFTTAVYGLKKAWDAVGVAAANTMDIYQQSLMAGTSPQTIERWQRVSEHQGLSAGAVPASFMSLRKFLYDFENLQIGEEFNKTIGLALKDVAGGDLITQAIMRSINTGNADTLLLTLNRFLSSGLINSAAAHDLLSVFGLDNQTMFTLLHQGTLATQLENAKLIYTGNPETLNASARYVDAKASLKDAWNSIWANPDMMDKATHLMNLIADKVLPKIEEFVTKYWPKIENAVIGLFDWLMEKITYIIERFGTKEDRNKFWQKMKNAAVGAVSGAAGGAILGGGIPGAVVGGIIGGISGYGMPTDSQPISKTMWDNLTPAEQFSLFMKGNTFGDGYDIPYGTISVNGGNATAIVNIDGHTVARTEGGNTSILDMMSIPTVER